MQCITPVAVYAYVEMSDESSEHDTKTSPSPGKQSKLMQNLLTGVSIYRPVLDTQGIAARGENSKDS